VWRGQSPQPFAQQPPAPAQAWGGAPLAPTGPEALDYSRTVAPPPPVQQPVYVAQQQPGVPGAAPPAGFQPGFAPPAGFAPPPGGQPVVGQPFGQPGVIPQPGMVPNFAADQPLQVFPGNEPYVIVDVDAEETQTGRLMIGAGVNSNAGLVGNIVVDEQNFDLFRLPQSWDDIRNGTAFRGAGQRFRLEAAPGTQLQRYTATFQEPYLFDTRIGLSTSASYFTRYFYDWAEARVGGRIGLGYQFQFAPDLSVNAGFRGESVDVFNPRLLTPAINNMVGTNSVYGFSGGIIHDTRDSPFLPTQGHLATFEFEQVIGTFVYPRGILEGRQYFLLSERADGSGRHVLSIGSVLGMSGPDTPAYDNFFAGGYNTIRGFTFRGASPRQMANGQSPTSSAQNAAIIGGPFQWLNTIEYLFPITADDTLRGVVFTDFGTVESNVSINQMRVAPGFGLRITLPAMGPAPIALDFAVPVAYAPYDNQQLFSFFVGFAR
jgi:outer membrane protein insertion porin family